MKSLDSTTGYPPQTPHRVVGKVGDATIEADDDPIHMRAPASERKFGFNPPAYYFIVRDGQHASKIAADRGTLDEVFDDNDATQHAIKQLILEDMREREASTKTREVLTR